MVFFVSLNDDWDLRFEPLGWGPNKHAEAALQEDGWMKTSLPCDVHVPLIESGQMKEPLLQDNVLECEWVEHKSWWFRKKFSVDDRLLSMSRVELTLESLDAEADVFLNGVWLGHHRNAFYPFQKEVKTSLRIGENELLVRLTTGVEYASGKDMARFKDRVSKESAWNRGDVRRIYVRKPQYGFGWDWAPRLATCGIGGDVYVTGFENLAIRSLRAITAAIARTYDHADLRFELEIERFHSYKTLEAEIQIDVLYNGSSVLTIHRRMPLRSGVNYIDFEETLPSAKLWWPNGMGEPNLYTIVARVTAGDETVVHPAFQIGVRTVQLDQQSIGPSERLFAFVINGVRVFSKGANWIPADSLYARIPDKKYETLVREAKECHFNMLRVWGGGLYERDIFYEECDRNGIMIWHDFMFACGLYPDDEEWFRNEVQREMDYQTRRLRHHASIVMWCGNNENHWFYRLWHEGEQEQFFGGEVCYNEIAPRVIRHNCPDLPYWNGSPYGGEHPNSEAMGDCHYWFDAMMSPEMNHRISPELYDRVQAKFVSEYGYIGPCRKSTIEKYHGGVEVDRHSRIWALHTNTFEKNTVAAGIAKHYMDVPELDLEQYLLFSGLCQGLMYGYSLESFRSNQQCSGSLFWMYNDCWGEIGWSIIDYELRRKIAYYFVKRAYAPLKLIVREAEGEVVAIGVNETTTPVVLDTEYGYVSFDGKVKVTKCTDIHLAERSRCEVFRFPMGGFNQEEGCYILLPKAGGGSHVVQPAILRMTETRKLRIPVADLQISEVIQLGDDVQFTVSASAYAHAVHFKLDDHLRLSDEYFDLLPGERRMVTVYGAADHIGPEQIRPVSVIL